MSTKVRIHVDLSDVSTERELHDALAAALDFGPYYGRNLDALWDRMTTDVERPLTLRLTNVSSCRQRLGRNVDDVVRLLHEVERHDEALGLIARFHVLVVEHA